MKSVTDTLSQFIYRLDYHDLPYDIISLVRLYIADFYAASLAGYRINRHFNHAVETLIDEEGGKEEASVLLSNKKRTCAQAAFLNSIYAHGADLDDGNKKAAGHIGTHVIPAVFALGETFDCKWSDIVVSIVVGYDVFNRIAGSAQPGLYNKGFHSTGIAGSLACAASCAKLLKLPLEQIYSSISIAAIQSSGLIIIDESGQDCKPINPGNATKIGIFSAKLAQRGIEGPINPLESEKGWYNAFSDNINESVIFSDLGVRYTISESYIKQYPSCRHTHSCIDAIKNIRKRISDKNRSVEDVESIVIYIYLNAIKSAGNIKYPCSSGEAKFSIYYAVARTLLNGNFSLCDLSVSLDEHTRTFIDKISLVVDDSMENRDTGIRGAKVKVVLKNKEKYEEIVDVPKGEGNNLLGWEELSVKMLSCSNGLVSNEIALNIIEKCKNIDFNAAYRPIQVRSK